MPETVIELTVRNHPGVMSHITGLFSRRAYNLEGILCGALPGGEHSRMYLLVNPDQRLGLIMRNLEKLYDVLDVRLRDDCDGSAFAHLDDLVAASRRRAA